MHRFTCSAGKLLLIPWILPNNLCCQAAFKVCLLKPCEECSRRKASILWVTNIKRHILQKSSNEAALVYGIISTENSTTLSSADWHTNTKDVLISSCEDRITAFLLANKLCWTVVKTPRPLKHQMHLIWLYLPAVTQTHAMHTRFVTPEQEGQALKYHSITFRSENCKKLQEARSWIREKD